MDALREEYDSWYALGEDMRKHALVNRIPFIGGFEITSRCNLKCPMCYIRQEDTADIRKKEASAQNWIDLGEKVFEAGTVHLLITGGEPLLRNDFKIIYEALSQMGFILTLYTNGTLINKEFMEWIKRIPPAKIGITLYGSCSEVYERFTGYRGAFDKVRNSVEMILDAGIPLNLRSTITKSNIDDLNNMKMFAKGYDIPINFVFNVIKPVRGAVCNEFDRLEPEEVCKNGLKMIPENVENFHKKGTGMFCSAGKCSYWVTWDGYLLPCAFFDDRDKYVLDNDFNKLWSLMGLQVNLIKSPQDCLVCEAKDYCSVCPGRLKAETGSYELLSEYICNTGKCLYNHFRERGHSNEEKV